jgi:isopentenyldiphosphate isomerase
MVTEWVIPQDTIGSPLLVPRPQYRVLDVEPIGEWDCCPIDDSPNYACFHLPGIDVGP